MNKKVTVVALRGLLSVGTEFESYLPYARDTANSTTRRRVVSNSAKLLSSLFLDGPKAGGLIYLDWARLKVETDGTHYYLINPDDGGPWFARFTLRSTDNG